MIEELKFLGYYVDSFRRNQIDQSLSKIESLDKTVIVFDLIGNFQLNLYYKEHHDTIVKEFNEAGYNFTFLPGTDFPDNTEDLISYFIPHLNEKIHFSSHQLFHLIMAKEKDNFKYFSSCAKDNKLLLEYLGYKGNIKSGFIICYDSLIHVIQYTNEDIINRVESPKQFIIDYGTKSKLINDENLFNSRRRVNPEFARAIDESLDEETLNKINSINKEIDALKASGKWLYILPLLKKTLEDLSDEVDLNLIGGVKFDDDYKIYIPYFNNLEIKLNSLSKAVYALFYNHPEGIRISELWKHEKELMSFYLNISNQNDLDRMNQSVRDITELGNKTIFTHISRIKSAFYNAMEESYAKNYIIDGAVFGSDLKYIPLIYNNSSNDEIDPDDVYEPPFI
ncbi:hypothetical protein [Moheibacter sediminis]|uniref:Uncharacterized protein n=1 Tax=Moheibacter sediminis TaxID=1434700 RepID=A0A1W2C7X0_9FLAO|nr:hypothetical protein [Moheibacter sediminis]SMC81253.1 hypothetical protein SAMN06296427_10947 [Moheibacter sediminis]